MMLSNANHLLFQGAIFRWTMLNLGSILEECFGCTLQETNISPKNGILKMSFLFPRWDMLVPWRVCVHEAWVCRYHCRTWQVSKNPIPWILCAQLPQHRRWTFVSPRQPWNCQESDLKKERSSSSNHHFGKSYFVVWLQGVKDWQQKTLPKTTVINGSP